MNLNRIDISLTEKDFNQMIERYAPQEGRVSKLKLDIHEGRLVITGSVKVVLNISFEVTMRLEHDDRRLIARLVSLKPMRLITDQLKEMILDKIVERMPEGATHEKDALFFDINHMVHSRGFDSDLTIHALRTADDAVTMEMSGSIGFGEAIV